MTKNLIGSNMNITSLSNDPLDDDSVSLDSFSIESNIEGDRQTKSNERDETKEVRRLASSETSHLRFWRLVVVALLLISGAVLSTFTYIFLKAQQKDDYVDAVRYVSSSFSPGKSMKRTQLIFILKLHVVLPICEYCS
jgi:hypothetical protein